MTKTIEIVTSRQHLADVDEKLAARLARESGKEVESIDLIRKAYADVKVDVDEDERSVVATISTEIVDRDSEVMLAQGMDKKWFEKNPVVMYAHNYGSLPIGRAAWIRKDKNRIQAKTIFATADANPEAEQIFQLFKGGFLRAWSIGFIVLDSREAKKGEFTQDVRRVITKWQLLEYSAVPVPSNMEALSERQKQEFKAFEARHPISDALKHQLGLVMAETGTQDDSALPSASRPGAEYTDEEVEKISRPVEGKPLPTEHACRLKDPGNFDRFRRGSRTSGGKTYYIIFGHPKAGGGWQEQAYRYKKAAWTAAEAGAHCKKHKGSFTAAKTKEKFNCECIDCGYKVTTEKHCNTFKCAKCGGTMRRAERPGPGQAMVRELDERLQAIEDAVQKLTPATVTITQTEPVQPTEPPTITVPDDFSEKVGETFAKKLLDGLGEKIDEKIAHARGRVTET